MLISLSKPPITKASFMLDSLSSLSDILSAMFLRSLKSISPVIFIISIGPLFVSKLLTILSSALSGSSPFIAETFSLSLLIFSSISTPCSNSTKT